MALHVVPAIIAGNVITADWGNDVAQFNTEAIAALPTASTVWSSPVNGGLTTTSGTVVAFYNQVGPVVMAMFKFTFGASSAVTGDISLTLPVTAGVSHTVTGHGWYFDSGTPSNSAPAFILSTSTTTCLLRAMVASTTNVTSAVLSSTVPFTWATGDMIIANVHYLAV